MSSSRSNRWRSAALVALLAATASLTAPAVRAAAEPAPGGAAAAGTVLAEDGDYVAIDLGDLGGFARATGINDAGQVVGSSASASASAETRPFRWDPVGGMTELSNWNYYSSAEDINDAGQIVGSTATFLNTLNAAIWEPDGTKRLLPIGYDANSVATAIDSDGTVVGWSSSGPSRTRAVRWDATGATDLGELHLADSDVRAKDIVDGTIVGTAAAPEYLTRHGFRFTDSAGMEDLGVLQSTMSSASGLNAVGQIVGTGRAWVGGWTEHAVLWEPDGSIRDLGVLPDGPNESSSASAINDAGTVVGKQSLPNGTGARAIVWDEVRGLRALPMPSGATSSAADINGAGQIVGTIWPAGGTARAVLWTPKPPTAPTVTSLDPNRGPAVGGTTVTIHGTDLAGATSVRFGPDLEAAFTVIDDTTIEATTPARAPSLVNVWVTTPAGTSTNTTSSWYLYQSADAPPDVTSIAPNRGPAAGGTTMTIHGTALAGATSVRFGPGLEATFTVVDDTTIEATTPPRAPSLVNVWVTTPGGTSTNAPRSWYLYEP